MSNAPRPVVNVDDVVETSYSHGDNYGGHYKPLTPFMGESRLGVNCSRVEPGRVACPFHRHELEDEAFYILSGTGVLRYGAELFELRGGDCVSCPAGTRTAHQIANTGDEDLVYLSIGTNEPNEVCCYPDTGKVMVRSLQRVGYLEPVDYYEGEPEPPRILELERAATPRADG